MIFRLKFLVKSASKWSFFRDPVLELQFMLLQLSLCRSQWNGCVKVSRCCGWVRNTILQLRVVNRIVMAASAYTMRSCRHGCNNFALATTSPAAAVACRPFVGLSACDICLSACRICVPAACFRWPLMRLDCHTAWCTCIWGIVASGHCNKSVCLRNCSTWKWDIRLLSRSATSAGRGVCKPWPLAWHSIGPCRTFFCRQRSASSTSAIISIRHWMAFAGHRRCGFCILVLTSINPWLPRIYQTNSKPSCWGGFFNKTCGRAFAAIIVAPYPWPMLSVGTTSAVLAAVPRGIEHQAAVSQRSGRRHFAGDPAQAGLWWRHFGSVAERSREEERTAVLPAFATPRCIPVARTAVLLACPSSFGLSGSRTQRRVRLCCSRALLTNGCSWRHSSSRSWKKCYGPSMHERWTHR